MAATEIKRQRIVDSLRRQILSGELPRGAHMPQDELARRFQASITPVREALRQLETEGLLVSEPHRGVRVASVDMEKVKSTYVVRRLVESYAMRRATTRLSPRDLQRGHALLDQMERDGASGDVDALRQGNQGFHFFFFERCGIPSLVDQIGALWQAFPWDLTLGSPERTEQSSIEHRAILDAVESGDLDAVGAATEVHLFHGFESIVRRLQGETGPVSDPFLLDND